MAIIITTHQINEVCKKLHGQDKSIVVTGGCFDLLHIGHIHLLENAKKQGDVLLVLIESDESIKKRKGINRPIHTQKERAHLVAALSAVDIVLLLPTSVPFRGYDLFLDVICPA